MSTEPLPERVAAMLRLPHPAVMATLASDIDLEQARAVGAAFQTRVSPFWKPGYRVICVPT